MHLVDFFVLQRGNQAGSDGLFAFERNAAKDIIFLGPSQEVWVIARCASCCTSNRIGPTLKWATTRWKSLLLVTVHTVTE
jgi:hypothetical protein